MRTLVSPELVREAEAFEFRFGCESCVHFDPESRDCSGGYPNDPHLGIELKRDREILFCKEFELG